MRSGGEEYDCRGGKEWCRFQLTTTLGLYKVAIGEDISKAEKPGMFDIKVRSHALLVVFLYTRQLGAADIK